MQLIPRYLLNDRTLVISNDVGFSVEFRPVYSRTIKIYKGVTNKVQFRLLNADQKPIELTTAPWIVVFDEEQNKIFEKEAISQDDNSSAATRGMFYVEFDDAELLDLKQQYLKYNIYIPDGTRRNVTYANRNFESAGIIYLDASSYPSVQESVVLEDFFLEQTGSWIAGIDNQMVSSEPAVNHNSALHTVAFYTNGYVGNIDIQVTLQDQITGQTQWATLDTIVFNGTETEPVLRNFNGVFSYIRFRADADPAGTITKILLRN